MVARRIEGNALLEYKRYESNSIVRIASGVDDEVALILQSEEWYV